MFYWIKIIHIISAALLLGVGMAATVGHFYLHQQKNLTDIEQVNRQAGYVDWFFTGVAGILQPLSGFALIGLHHYALSTRWWTVVLLGYGLAATCWFPAIYLRMKCLQLVALAVASGSNLSIDYYRYYRARLFLSVIALAALTLVFYWMAQLTP